MRTMLSMGLGLLSVGCLLLAGCCCGGGGCGGCGLCGGGCGACGGCAALAPAATTTTTAVASLPAPAAVVTMGIASYHPAKVAIAAGQTVEWKNRTLETHTVTCDPSLATKSADVILPAGAMPFNSGNIGPSGNFYHTFTAPGTYKYFCKMHEGMGMVGEVDVTPAQ